MKYFLSLSLAVIVVFNLIEIIPRIHAPEALKQNALQAALLEDPGETDNDTIEIESEKTLLITLLDLYVEQERNLPKATSIIDQHSNKNSDKKILELYKAKILARSLDFEQALTLLNQIDHGDVPLLKAAVLISLDDREKAQSYLYELIENHPNANIKSTALTLIQIYHEHDMHRDADGSYLWVLFAKHFSKLGEVEISQYLVEKSLAISPEYRDAWLIKGMNEIGLKKHIDAETSLLRAYQSDPGNLQIQYLLGHNYFLQKEYELSKQYFLYSLQQESPYGSETLVKLGEIGILEEDFPLSAHYFNQLLETNSTHPIALSQLIWLYGEQLGDPDIALELAERRESAYPDDPQSKELLRWILAKLGELDEAEKYLE